MHEIICPHCNKAFKIDEAGYADIVKQIRDKEFEKQLSDRLALAEKEKENAVNLAKADLTLKFEKDASAKIAKIQELTSKIDHFEVTKKLAINEAVQLI